MLQLRSLATWRCAVNLLRNRQRLLIVISSAVFCLLATERYVWYAFGPESWTARFACREPSIDCGNVSGQMVRHGFIVRNTGRQRLRIWGAAADCTQCLTVTVVKDEVTPGGTAVVEIALDTAKIKRKGPFHRKVVLETNDANRPQVSLYVRGNCI